MLPPSPNESLPERQLARFAAELGDEVLDLGSEPGVLHLEGRVEFAPNPRLTARGHTVCRTPGSVALLVLSRFRLIRTAALQRADSPFGSLLPFGSIRRAGLFLVYCPDMSWKSRRHRVVRY